ncbi:MAG: coenzyme F420-0:L-glutamate ligase [Candidatus Bathyarchaeia archaeon]
MRVKVRRVRTRYWRPGTDYIKEILTAVSSLVRDGDIISISEKAISVAQGNIIDEGKVNPGPLAQALARFWMRVFWGHFLGFLCRLRRRTIETLKRYPLEEGARHKQVALDFAGMLQALRFGSEGGIDSSNLPYSYSCLPLRDPASTAAEIGNAIRNATGRDVIVLITDSDKTYSLRGFHLSPTYVNFEGIFSGGGFLTYLMGRFFKMKPRSTPKAVYPLGRLHADEALDLAEYSHQIRGHGSGRTVWEMAERFGVGLTGVTWEMLEAVDHYPIVLIRRVD